MSILFPPSLNQHLLLGHSEGAPTGSTKEVATLSGLPILLPTGSSRHRPIQGMLHVQSDAQLELFEDWHWETLNRGTRRFLWHRPGRAGDETLELQFTGEHYSVAVPAPVGYLIQMSLLICRRVS
jgi:hypothetical protein